MSLASDVAVIRGDSIVVDLREKSIALDHDGVIHAIREHGGAAEEKRGQVPITADDLAIFDQIFNAAILDKGDPAIAKDGTKLFSVVATIGEWTYGFVAKVRRLHIVPYTLFKRVKK